MQPITSGVLSFAFLHEAMSQRQVGGGARIRMPSLLPPRG